MKTTGDGFHAVFTTAHDAIGAAAAAPRVLTSEQWAETETHLLAGAVKTRRLQYKAARRCRGGANALMVPAAMLSTTSSGDDLSGCAMYTELLDP